ncbi:DUF1345 domain-containing protein [Mucilaginibacter sp. RS28]|uniref:DUF1345 domain-containing protein n=1 Tax=Mucilaginibacter straminoryzae TaxID=2932774 RepID=A0A9X1X1A7_9SPHI|nr:DUF1345 domain-containing protein [Mucilaginibacter straminoryzae]MCJ8209319.1 DUF1345 domain-containing protein [Mucilaginibacter straminoryzae]
MTQSTKFRNPILRLDTHLRIFIAVFIALIVFFSVRKNHTLPEVVLFSWITYAVCHIVFDWVLIASLHPRQVCKMASLEDKSRSLIFVIVIAASIMSLVAILFLLKSTKTGDEAVMTAHVLLSVISVVVSWWMVHTVFAMRYAYLYYDTTDDEGNAKKEIGGLEFPKTPDPDYMDFVYFSYVIGMTFQVSDVEISSRQIRRLAWVHGLISFAFNTAIVALSINIISGLVSSK